MPIITLVILQKWLQALTTCLRPGSTNRSNLSLGREIKSLGFARALWVWPDLSKSMGKHAANHEHHTHGGHCTRRVYSVPYCTAVNDG